MNAAFTPGELAVLSGLIEAGVRLSGDRLAALTATRWAVVSSSVEVVPVVRALTVLHNHKGRCVGARMRSQSLLPLDFIMIFPEDNAARIAEAVAKAFPTTHPLRDPVGSVVGEVANILGQGVVKEIADRFEISIILSVAKISLGEEASLAASALDTFDARKDAAVLMRVEMNSEDLSAVCRMLMMLDVDTTRRLMRGGGRRG